MKSNKKAVFVIFITVFIDLVGFGIIIPLSPYLSKAYGATPFQSGLLMSIYSLMQFIFSPIWGRLSDRIGRRPIILMSLLGASLSYLAFAYSTTFIGLIIARMFAGVFGANISTAMAYIADITEAKDRSKGMGLIGAAFGLGFVFGPFIGGMAGELGKSLGSAPPFGINFSAIVAATICFLNFLMALKTIKETLTPEKRAMPTKRGKRLELILKHIRKPIVGPLIFVFFLSGFAMAHMEANLFLYVSDEFGWGMKLASYGFAYIGIMMVFTQGYLIRKLMPRIGERKLMVMGLVFFTFGLGGIGYCEAPWSLAIVMTILAFGNGFTNPSILGSISILTDSTEQGAVMGVTQSLSSLARILGPPIGGLYYEKISHSAPFTAGGILLFVGLLIIVFLFKRLPEKGKS